jgi:hypothetical protein
VEKIKYVLSAGTWKFNDVGNRIRIRFHWEKMGSANPDSDSDPDSWYWQLANKTKCSTVQTFRVPYSNIICQAFHVMYDLKYQAPLFTPPLPTMVWRFAKRRRMQYKLKEAGQTQVSAISRR